MARHRKVAFFPLNIIGKYNISRFEEYSNNETVTVLMHFPHSSQRFGQNWNLLKCTSEENPEQSPGNPVWNTTNRRDQASCLICDSAV